MIEADLAGQTEQSWQPWSATRECDPKTQRRLEQAHHSALPVRVGLVKDRSQLRTDRIVHTPNSSAASVAGT
jgi:hypothetical protein